MGRFMRNALLVVWAWLMLTGVCLGKQVYLRDGGIVECQSVWLRGDLVVVKINRDTLVEFERKEIDLRRTHLAGGKKTHRVRHGKPAGVVRPLGAAKPASAAAVPAPVNSPVASATPAAKPAQPAPVSSATPVKPAPVPLAKPLPVPAAEPVAKAENPPEPAEPAASPTKEEAEKVRKQAAEMMAEAIQKKDAEMMKKAMELQRSAMPQNDAQVSGMSIKILLMILVVSLLIVVSM